MKLKTLLLSSAAVFTVVGGAQAADLTVAEPVDYVQVCDAFGTGYWYIPGTTTCINIGGEVTFDINFHESKSVLDGQYTSYDQLGTGTGYGGDFDYAGWSGQSNHSAGWDFVTGAKVSVTAKSATEYGDLTAYVKMAAKSDNSKTTYLVSDRYVEYGPGQDVYIDTVHTPYSPGSVFTIDEAWLQLGMVTAGYLHSAYDWKGGYIGTAIRGDEKVDQLRFTWAMGGFGLILSVEDPRDRWGTQAPGYAMLPEIAGAITASQGNWSGQLSAIVGAVNYANYFNSCSGNKCTVWGVNGGIEFKPAPVSIRLAGAVGTGTSYVGGGTNGYTNWSAFASAKAPLSSTMDIAGMVSYLWDGAPGAPNKWAAAGGLIWSPVSEFSVEGRVTWNQTVGSTGSWGGRIELKRKWGAD
jgi:hypothetical protein